MLNLGKKLLWKKYVFEFTGRIYRLTKRMALLHQSSAGFFGSRYCWYYKYFLLLICMINQMLFKRQEDYLFIPLEQVQAHQNHPLLCFFNESQYNQPDQEICSSHLMGNIFCQLFLATKEMHPENIIAFYPPKEEPHIDQSVANQQKNPSTFHNFQKHLCAFLKRMITIKEEDASLSQAEKCAIDIWTNFFKKHSYTKKNLYSMFGITTSMRKSSPKTPTFSKLSKANNYSLELVIKARVMLRQIVITQCRTISKSFFLSQCRAKNSQQFYSYFQLFIQDLTQFSNFKPMTKARLKKQLLNSTYNEV